VNRETGTTTAIVSHNVAIAGIADRVIRMSSGEIQDIVTNATRADVDSVSW
jgi:putative ABC transport system ATP-binding protein